MGGAEQYNTQVHPEVEYLKMWGMKTLAKDQTERYKWERDPFKRYLEDLTFGETKHHDSAEFR